MLPTSILHGSGAAVAVYGNAKSLKAEAGQGWDPRRSKRASVVKAKADHDETETESESEDTETVGFVKATAGHEKVGST